MDKQRILIIDDESKLRQVLRMKIVANCPNYEIIGEAGSVDEGLRMIKKHSPTIVLLDIAMPGSSGLELFNRIEKVDFEVIFVTGYDEYALSALKVSAVDYLLKPVRTDELIAALNKAASLNRDKEKLERYEILAHNINHVGDQETKIAISGAESYEFVEVADILRCEGWQKYTRIFLKDGRMILSSYNIGVFKKMLTDYGFFSSHKSHLINTRYVIRYLKEGIVVMVDNSEVPLARRRKDDFQDSVLSKILRIQ